MQRHRVARHPIGAVVSELKRNDPRKLTDTQLAQAIGITPGAFCLIQSNQQSPTWEQIALFSRYYDVHPMTLFPRNRDLFVRERDGLRWQVRPGVPGPRAKRIRDVTHWVLQGLGPREIAERLARTEGDADVAAIQRKWAIAEMARAGLARGYVELELSKDAREVVDAALAADLADALKRYGHCPGPVAVHVLRNLAHPAFQRDPIVPALAARVAHAVVARFLEEHPHFCTIGIAGGVHLGAFVRAIGPESSPFPEDDDRRYVLVPLTLEPFHDHAFELADSLVGDFSARARDLLGSSRIEAPSFKPFGFLEEGKVGPLETEPITVIREYYHRLDVAIYGCGDRSDDGWIDWNRRMLRLAFDPPTDVCLNALSRQGELMPLPCATGRREYLGVNLDDVQGLVARRKLGLLLASGETKGLPLTLVARAGCLNVVVCDQAAARAALEVLRPRRQRTGGGHTPRSGQGSRRHPPLSAAPSEP